MPAVRALLRRDEAPYVRLHAARAVAFFGCIALAQLALLAFLVIGGAFARDLPVAALLGLVAWAYIVVEFVLAVRVWRRSLASALAGRDARRGRLGPVAVVLESVSLRVVDAASQRWERLTARHHPTDVPRTRPGRR